MKRSQSIGANSSRRTETQPHEGEDLRQKKTLMNGTRFGEKKKMCRKYRGKAYFIDNGDWLASCHGEKGTIW